MFMVKKFLNFLRRGKVKKLKLYDSLDTILIKTFYEILATNNLQLLNPTNKRVKEEVLIKIWENLQEEFFKRSDKEKYQSLLKRQKKIEILKNKLFCCSISLDLYNLGREEVSETLKYFGYDVSQGVEKIRRKLLLLQTKIEFLELKKQKENKKEEINFWKTVAILENSIGRELTGVENWTASRWIEKLNEIKEQNERKNK